jgi:hypothetical protein
MVTFTKAPWTLEEHEDEPCKLIGNGTIHIADIYATDFPAGAADARLIQAAPLMYETLQALAHQLTVGEASQGSLRDINWCAKQARAVLEVLK